MCRTLVSWLRSKQPDLQSIFFMITAQKIHICWIFYSYILGNRDIVPNIKQTLTVIEKRLTGNAIIRWYSLMFLQFNQKR